MYELRNVDADRMVRLGDVLDIVEDVLNWADEECSPEELVAQVEAAVIEEVL